MSRTQWATIAAWTFLVVCIVTAGIVTFLQVSRRLATMRATALTRREIQDQIHQLERQEQERQAIARRLIATDTAHEDAAFLQKLQQLIVLSGAHPLQIESVPVAVLPDIEAAKDEAESRGRARQPAEGGPSLAHLPLRTQARSTRVVLYGDLVTIRRFLSIVAHYSAGTRWINTNSLRLERAGNGPALHATILITRFLRPASAGSDLNTAAGAARDRDSRPQ